MCLCVGVCACLPACVHVRACVRVSMIQLFIFFFNQQREKKTVSELESEKPRRGYLNLYASTHVQTHTCRRTRADAHWLQTRPLLVWLKLRTLKVSGQNVSISEIKPHSILFFLRQSVFWKVTGAHKEVLLRRHKSKC